LNWDLARFLRLACACARKYNPLSSTGTNYPCYAGDLHGRAGLLGTWFITEEPSFGLRLMERG